MAGGVIAKVTAGGGTHLISNTFYGTCETAATTAAKIVKLVDSTQNSASLITGMLLCVKFTEANGAVSPTLTVQSSSGTQLIAAKSIIRYGDTAAGGTAASSWRAGAIVPFVYDGINWVEVSSIDNDTLQSPKSLGFSFWTSSTAASTVIKAVNSGNDVPPTNGSIFSVKFIQGNAANHPSLKFDANNQTYDIYWQSSQLSTINSDLIKENDIVTFIRDGSVVHIIGIIPFFYTPIMTNYIKDTISCDNGILKLPLEVLTACSFGVGIAAPTTEGYIKSIVEENISEPSN